MGREGVMGKNDGKERHDGRRRREDDVMGGVMGEYDVMGRVMGREEVMGRVMGREGHDGIIYDIL